MGAIELAAVEAVTAAISKLVAEIGKREALRARCRDAEVDGGEAEKAVAAVQAELDEAKAQ